MNVDGNVWPLGYVTGSAVPEQAKEADVLFGVDSTSERDAAPESAKPLKTKAVPETVAAISTGSITPEEALAVGVPEVTPEANIKSHPVAGPDRLGVKGLPAGETGATGKLNVSGVGLHVIMQCYCMHFFLTLSLLQTRGHYDHSNCLTAVLVFSWLGFSLTCLGYFGIIYTLSRPINVKIVEI